MFWTAILILLLTLLVLKLYKVLTFWNDKGIPQESFLRALYRNLWLYTTKVTFDVADDNVRKYGRVYGTFRGFVPVLVVAELEGAKDVLIKQFTNFFRRSFDIETGDKLWDNLLGVLPYEHWKGVRTLLGQCFTTSKLKGMIPKFDKMAKRTVGQLETISNSKENEITLKKFVQAYGLDSVVAAAFGVDLNCAENHDSPFLKHASDLFNPSFSSYLFMMVPWVLKYYPWSDFPPRATTKFFTKFGKHILEEKRRNLDEVIKNGTADIMDNFLIAQREDPKNTITDDVLTSQAFLFYLGGVDTSVVTLEMTTFFMALNPKVQDKVVEEIKSVLGNRVEVEYDDIQKMKYLDATIQEALRFYPISFMIDRICNQKTTVVGVEIPEGTIVEMPIRYLHFDPEIFPEPNKFMPERFLKENFQDAGIQGFLTFGDGPKNCVGRRLAIMNLQVLLVNILMKVKLETCEATPKSLKLKTGMNFTNVTEKPLVLKIVPRNWNSPAN